MLKNLVILEDMKNYEQNEQKQLLTLNNGMLIRIIVIGNLIKR